MGSRDPGRDARGRSFGTAARLYDRLRPAPSDEVLAWVLRGRRSDILDLAAGTGQISRRLLAGGCRRVVAVEPDPGMRDVLRAEVPGVGVLDGTAEAIPLPTASLAAVVVGSAWHWFDQAAAAAEIGRVLVGGGVLGVLGLSPDIAVDWVRDLLVPADLERLRSGQRRYTEVSLPDPFGPVELAQFADLRREPVADVVSSFRTHSRYRESPPAERAAITRRVRERLATRASTDAVVELPMRTLCWRVVRQG